jgi:hypothetical protein
MNKEERFSSFIDLKNCYILIYHIRCFVNAYIDDRLTYENENDYIYKSNLIMKLKNEFLVNLCNISDFIIEKLNLNEKEYTKIFYKCVEDIKKRNSGSIRILEEEKFEYNYKTLKNKYL